jgi:hypothetical protein
MRSMHTSLAASSFGSIQGTCQSMRTMAMLSLNYELADRWVVNLVQAHGWSDDTSKNRFS